LESLVVIGLEDGWVPAFAVGEQAVLVVAHEAAEPVLADDLDHPAALRPTVDEVPEEEQVVVVPRRQLIEKVLQLVGASVNISNGDEFSSHRGIVLEPMAAPGHDYKLPWRKFGAVQTASNLLRLGLL
jgi:hypothetical protein